MLSFVPHPFEQCRIRLMNFFFQSKHTYICDFHKNIIQKARNKRKRKDSDDENDSSEVSLFFYLISPHEIPFSCDDIAIMDFMWYAFVF